MEGEYRPETALSEAWLRKVGSSDRWVRAILF